MYKLLILLILLQSYVFAGAPQKNDGVEQKIKAMTLEEKIDFIGGYKSFHIRGYEHLGIPEINMADGPIGVRNFGKSTAYPAGINLAASWDKELAYKIGKAIGSEARSQNAHIMLGPAMNIYRYPLCGRNFEYLGEDPYLAGELAKENTLGIQDQGIMATAKHYVANNQEYNRHHVSSDMDERTLHEIYLPAFKKNVEEGKVATIMTAYNLINGVHASEHDYLNNQILKEKWGFDGFIMSDWVSTYDGLACAKGGLDLEMPSGAFMSREVLIPAIKTGELDESVIDDKIRRILNTYQRFGYFDIPDISKNYVLDSAFVRDVSLDAARGGMVLLKNDKDFLPLKKEKLKTIAIIGPNGFPAVTGGGGSSRVEPLYPLSLLEAVKKVVGNGTGVVFEKGVYTGVEFADDMFEGFGFYVYEVGEKKNGMNAEYFQDKKLQGGKIYSAFYEDISLVDGDMWDIEEIPEKNYSARFYGFYTAPESGNYSFGVSGDDGYRLFLDGIEVISMWRDQGDAKAKYDVFLNAGEEHKIVLEYYQSGGEARLRLGVKKYDVKVQPEQYLPKAIEVAKKADLVIMAVGFSWPNESEGFDRTFELPFNQNELISKVAEVNKNVVVVLNAGGNVEMESWIDKVNGLLMAWYPGQEGNLAAAEILFGETNPSGKLPASFAYKIEENPTHNFYFDDDEDLKVHYGEGIFVGYRYWDKSGSHPRYPFGFGLSYTTFEYSDISIVQDDFEKEGSISVSIKIKNVGNFDGAEIVQLYVSDKESSLPRPVKELKAFDKIELKTGEEKSLSFNLGKDAFQFYNPDLHSWVFENGDFEILIGSSSTKIMQSATVMLNQGK